MRIKYKLLLIIFLAVITISTSSQAGILDIFKPKPPTAQEEACAKQIRAIRKFLYDGRLCKSDDDCIVMEGICPMGCNFYLNTNFEQIIVTEKEKLAEICPKTKCAYNCPKQSNVIPVCVRNKCQAKSLK